jgi:hypothetical protein
MKIAVSYHRRPHLHDEPLFGVVLLQFYRLCLGWSRVTIAKCNNLGKDK